MASSSSLAIISLALCFLVFVSLGPVEEVAARDCLSGQFKGPCAVWDNERCRRICKEDERKVSGHCSAGLKCWCEGC